MNDRELLEAAAKAAGIDAHWGKGWQADMMFRAAPRPNSPLVANVEWNPLADDGDALRLAVDLGLSIEFGNDGESYSVAWDGCIGSGKFYHRESDRRNATRWAIVTVAAQADPKTPNVQLSRGAGTATSAAAAG